MNEIVFRYLHVKGINGRKMWSTWQEMYDLLAQDVIAVEAMISHRFPIGEFKTAMELVNSGECAKVVLEY
jgi:threonine 3-dehydrogenase